MIQSKKLQRWMEQYPSISDLKKKAKKSIPFVAWEYLDSGTGEELALKRNRQDFQKITLAPRLVKGAFTPDTSTELFGKKYAAPFGVAPVGLSGLMWPKAEQYLAEMSVHYNIPYSLSTVATMTPEVIGRITQKSGFFQLYPPRGSQMRNDLLTRAWDSGFRTLLVTADVPMQARRERSNKAGLRMPPRINLRFIGQALKNPTWTLCTLKNGLPRLRTMEKYANAKDLAKLSEFMGSAIEGSFSWDYLKEIRDFWKGNLLLKGILHPEDATKALTIGLDGICISNHGARQFDGTPSSIQALKDIMQVLKHKTTIILDSGVRTGLDIAKSLILGADFVLLGRAYFYGLAALGKGGAYLVTEILKDDLKVNMAQLGAKNLSELKSYT
jgi:L-lactate dehydrogenase (cytochrome)